MTSGNGITPLFLIKTGAGSTTTPAFVMGADSGMRGIAMFWPGQCIGSPSHPCRPVPYGWAITSTGTPANDRVVLRNLLLINPYLGIFQDFGGQWEIDNVYGNPISIGLKMDRVLDGTEVHNVHWWTFWVTGHDSTYAFTQHHGIGFLFDRVDVANISDIEVYGMYRGFDFEQDRNGSAWLNISNFALDSVTQGVHIGAANIINLVNGTISGSIEAGYKWGITTGPAIGLRSNVNISNVEVYALYSGADITSRNGNFTFTNFVGRAASNGDVRQTGTSELDGPLVVNESTANVEVWGNYAGAKAVVGSVSGGSTTAVNGIAFPGQTANVTPRRFAAPSRWDHNESVKAVPDGTRFSLTTKSLQRLRFNLDTDLQPGLYTLTFQYKGNILLFGPGQWSLRLQNDAGSIFWRWPFSSMSVENLPVDQPIQVSLPLYVPRTHLHFEWVFGNAIRGAVTIAHLAIHRVPKNTDTAALLPLLYGSIYALDPLNQGPATLARNFRASGTISTASITRLPSSASFTTTAASSDTIRLPDTSPESRCLLTPTNSIAARFNDVYVKKGKEEVIVHHPPIAGGTFDLVCLHD